MLLIFRVIVVVLLSIFISLFGIIYCLFSPRNGKNIFKIAHYFSKLAPIVGLNVIKRPYENIDEKMPCIFIANHQSNYDVIFGCCIVRPNTVTVGKKSLAWIPLWGQMYWLSGNILIDRNNKHKARAAIQQVVDNIKKRNISVWMFPEGTRNQGRGLLPFKTGAFHAAIEAGIPIVPICISSTHDKIHLNRCNNGAVIIEMLAPIETVNCKRENVRELAEYCHQLMEEKIQQLDQEVNKIDLKDTVQ